MRSIRWYEPPARRSQDTLRPSDVSGESATQVGIRFPVILVLRLNLHLLHDRIARRWIHAGKVTARNHGGTTALQSEDSYRWVLG